MIERVTKIESFIKHRKSVLILGPRGTGKSFYINHLLGGRSDVLLIDLLNPETYEQFLKQPGQLGHRVDWGLDQHRELLVFIDEIQRVPALLNEVHRLIELHRNKIQFILTGSSARKLRRGQANLLAGRALYHPFYPLNCHEIDMARHLDKVMQFGTLPKAFLEDSPDMRSSYLRTYTHVYLKEEIQQESLTRNIEAFAKFLEFAAFENGQPINYSKISKQLGISQKTVQGHFQILEDTLLAIRIPAWTFSVRKQLLKMPKYYFFDNGVLNSLTGELRTELKESSYRFGRLFENLVVNEIIRHNSLNEFDHHLYHYRTNHGAEIDLIVQKNIKSPPIAIEIKSSVNPGVTDVKPLTRFHDEFPGAKRLVICRTSEPYIVKGISFLPLKAGLDEIFQKSL